MRVMIAALALVALVGCAAQKQTADNAPSTETPAAPPAATTAESGTEAVAAGAPQLIAELTDQKLVYECPKCGMDFDGPGTCSMGCAELVATKVDYSCPQDGQAVAAAGKCPRCPMNARVQKSAMANATPADSH